MEARGISFLIAFIFSGAFKLRLRMGQVSVIQGERGPEPVV